MKLLLPLGLIALGASAPALAQTISAGAASDLEGVGEGVFTVAEDTITSDDLVPVAELLTADNAAEALLDLQRLVQALGTELQVSEPTKATLSSLAATARATAPAETASPPTITPSALTAEPAPISCSIRPEQVIELASPLEGIVSRVHVRPGDLVQPGDFLVELDSALLSADMSIAQAEAGATARLELAKQKRDAAQSIFDTTKRGYDRKVVARLEFERATADLALAERDVMLEQEALELAKLRAIRAEIAMGKSKIFSPVGGIIGEDMASPGESTSGDPLLTITVVQPLRVAAIVPQSRLSEILIAQDFTVRVGVDAPREYQVAMDYVSPTVDQASNTILAFFTFETNEVVPGQRCRLVAN